MSIRHGLLYIDEDRVLTVPATGASVAAGTVPTIIASVGYAEPAVGVSTSTGYQPVVSTGIIGHLDATLSVFSLVAQSEGAYGGLVADFPIFEIWWKTNISANMDLRFPVFRNESASGGYLTAALSDVAAALTGKVGSIASLRSTLPEVTVGMGSGSREVITLPAITSALTGIVVGAGVTGGLTALDATFPALTMQFEATNHILGELRVSTSFLAVELSAMVESRGSLGVTLPELTAVHRTIQDSTYGSLHVTIAPLTPAFSAYFNVAGGLDVLLPVVKTAFEGSTPARFDGLISYDCDPGSAVLMWRRPQ